MLLEGDVSRLRFAARFCKGAGGGVLGRLGILRVRDLLLHIPSHYNDYTHIVSIAHADVGATATIMATVDNVELKRPRPHLQLVEVYVLDDTGVMRVTFFRQPWVAEQLARGDTIMLSGKVDFSYGFRHMSPTFWEKVEDDTTLATLARIVPTYPLTEGIGVGWMRRIISAALADVGDICDVLPAELVAQRHLMGLSQALREVHFPQTLASAQQARRRLAYDELLCLQLSLLTRQQLAHKGVLPVRHTIDGPHLQALRAALPFVLTDEQHQAIHEILQDMAAEQIMNRLLLGHVGTGKTILASCALAGREVGVNNGCNTPRRTHAYP
jgi:ATP-dependent DNA helicase RecG